MSSDNLFRELVRLELDAATFGASWAHCGQMSSHVAALVSHKRRDPLYYENLLSSALNELLELAFRVHGTQGRVACTVLHAGGRDRIVIEIPCDAEGRAFYEDAVKVACGTDAGERYLACLLDEAAFDPRIGLFELAVDYGAAIRLDPAEGGIRLMADLVLDELQG